MRLAVSAWFWDRLTTGSGQYARRLVEALTRVNSDLEILLVRPDSRVTGASHEPYDWPAEAASPTNSVRENLAKVWFEQLGFPRACRRLGVDIAHVPYWAPPVLVTVPTIVTIHDLIPRVLPAYRGGLAVRAYTTLVSLSTGRAARILADSKASRNDILAHLGVPAARVQTVYLAAADAYKPEADSTDDTLRSHLGLPDRYILYVGGFDVRKNVGAALAAFAEALPAIPGDCPFVIAGRLPERDTPFRPDPRRLANELGLGLARLRFLGRVDEAAKPALYRGATAFLFPSRYEGFGLPPLEAMACGTPVVGSNTSSMPEVVGEGGLLYEPDDTAGMAGAIARLARSGAFRAEFRVRALAQAARFSWERTAEQTLAAYQRVVSAR